MRETRVWSLDWEDPLEKEMATHSSTVAWRIPWREEPGRPQSMGSQRVGHDWATSLHFWHLLNMQYINYGHHAMYYIRMSHLFYNWKFIPSHLPHPSHPLPSLPTSGTTNLFFVSMNPCEFFLVHHINETIWYLSFSIWLISPSIMPSRSIHVLANGKISFFLMAG